MLVAFSQLRSRCRVYPYATTALERMSLNLGDMMLYYFNLTNGAETIPDDQGVEVFGRNLALLQALQTIEELRAEDLSSSYAWKGWWLEIIDEEGVIVEIFPLDEDPNHPRPRH